MTVVELGVCTCRAIFIHLLLLVFHAGFHVVVFCVKFMHVVLFTIVLDISKRWNIFCTFSVTIVLAKEEKKMSAMIGMVHFKLGVESTLPV